MREEIGAAVEFLTCLVGKNTDITAEQVQLFQHSLDSILTEKFEGHWFPDQPNKGQAYRCIRVNSSVPWDSALQQAAKRCGLRYENLKLPLELTVWVDPQEVCCRFGENCGSFYTIASFKDDKENFSENVKVENTSVPSILHQDLPDNTRKQKSRRKTMVDRPKKPISYHNVSNNHISVKSFTPKVSFSPKYISSRPSNIFDWNPAAFPFSSRIVHHSGYQDLSFMRRPRKQIRSAYLNERFNWARK